MIYWAIRNKKTKKYLPRPRAYQDPYDNEPVDLGDTTRPPRLFDSKRKASLSLSYFVGRTSVCPRRALKEDAEDWEVIAMTVQPNEEQH